MRIYLLVIVALLALAGSARGADEPLRTGPYMSAFIGGSAALDTNVDSEQFPTGSFFSDRWEFDPGLNAGLTGGYNFGFFRLEGEASYKSAEISDITDRSGNFNFRRMDGDIAAFAVMCNGFFDMRNPSRVTPYLGGGIGYAAVYLRNAIGTDTRGGVTTRDRFYAEAADSVFAYQVGGGVEIALNSLLSLDLSYRYFGTSKAKLEDDWFNRTEFIYRSHNAGVGLRVKF